MKIFWSNILKNAVIFFLVLHRVLAVQTLLFTAPSLSFGLRSGMRHFGAKSRVKSDSALALRRKSCDDFYEGKSLSPKYYPKSDNQKKYYHAVNNQNIPIVLGLGPAGTGKTLFACIAAIEALKVGKIQKILLTRPIVPVDEEELGFLPGDLKNKMAYGRNLSLIFSWNIIPRWRWI